MYPSGGIDELSRDAHPVWRFANAAFQHVAHTKLAPDHLHVDGAPLVCEARIAGDDEQRLEMRQRRDDVLDHSISEVVLFRITAHVGEWQYSDGGLIRKGKGGFRFWRNCRFRFLRARNREHLHRSRDVLQRDLALVVETHIDPVTDLIVNSTSDRNASRHSDAFEPRCNIDAIAEDLVCRLLLEKKKNADAEPEPRCMGGLRVLSSHRALTFDGASR